MESSSERSSSKAGESTVQRGSSQRQLFADRSTVVVQAKWFVGAALVAFAVPFLGTSVFDLHHDLYLLLYMTSVIALLGVYVRATGVDVRAVVRRNLPASLLVAAALAVPLVLNVFSEAETERPSGLYFVFELIWRGGLYGAVDALLLTALPCVIVLSCLGGRLDDWLRRITYFVTSIVLIMVMTATYHFGYEQFREDGIRGPETGNILMSMPALLTANPVGSVLDHSAMHIAAVVHEYETGLRLPPQTDAPDD